MVYQIKSYLQFLGRATNRHGVHSPFVYDLLTQCFYDSSHYSEYSILKKHRDLLLQSDKSISVSDFGAGSRVFNSNERKVSAIAKNAGITRGRQRLLFRISRYLKPNHILELGTSLGMGTVALALGHSGAKVATVEGCSNTSAKAQELFDVFELDHIQLETETFGNFFSKPMQKYDLIYIDGNHDRGQTLQYFELLLKSITNDSVLIFDDIYWSPEMTRAWQEICAHPAVTVSIDTFHWGLIFFRREQEKQHFSIRM